MVSFCLRFPRNGSLYFIALLVTMTLPFDRCEWFSRVGRGGRSVGVHGRVDSVGTFSPNVEGKIYGYLRTLSAHLADSKNCFVAHYI